MHFHTRVLVAALALTAAPVFADTLPIRVVVPAGLHTSNVVTAEAPSAAQKYVTIEGVEIVNPSTYLGQSFRPQNFHLLIGDQTYLPVVRPHLGSVDLSEPSILGPRERTDVTISFLVPASASRAKLEFTPHWYDDTGFTVDWCCFY